MSHETFIETAIAIGLVELGIGVIVVGTLREGLRSVSRRIDQLGDLARWIATTESWDRRARHEHHERNERTARKDTP